jgi:hypothetical protein
VRVLLDENLPHDLTGLLVGHAVETVAGRGWAGIRNGELLKRAGGTIDAFLTMDRRLPDQQRIAELPFGVILILAPSNRLIHLRPLVPEMLRILPVVAAGSLHAVGA